MDAEALRLVRTAGRRWRGAALGDPLAGSDLDPAGMAAYASVSQWNGAGGPQGQQRSGCC